MDGVRRTACIRAEFIFLYDRGERSDELKNFCWKKKYQSCKKSSKMFLDKRAQANGQLPRRCSSDIFLCCKFFILTRIRRLSLVHFRSANYSVGIRITLFQCHPFARKWCKIFICRSNTMLARKKTDLMSLMRVYCDFIEGSFILTDWWKSLYL